MSYTQKQINDALIAATIPKIINSTVPLVAPYGKGIRCIGTGTLLRIRQKHFVITAKHVLEGNQNQLLIATKLKRSVPHGGGIIDSNFDIGIIEILSTYLEDFRENTFIELSDTLTDEIPTSSILTFIGYPSVWVDQDASILKPLQYTGYRYENRVPGYKDDYYIFISALPNESTGEPGDPISYRGLDGTMLNFPEDLRGVSGCGVWMIGDRLTEPQTWKLNTPKLVGVETGVFNDPKSINVLRWIIVTTLIHSAYPDLRDLFKSDQA